MLRKKHYNCATKRIIKVNPIWYIHHNHCLIRTLSIAHIDTKRRYIYVIAALVKSLADVPEQIWHALENHRYLHASRLYILAKKVHEYLDQEKKRSTIDIEVAFPVIQRQWDAVSAFGPQIIQRSTHYLRVSEQTTEVFLSG